MNLAVFISGTGSNFVAIYKAIENRNLSANIKLVVSNNPESLGLETAQSLGFSTVIFDRRLYIDGKQFALEMLAELRKHTVDFIVLAGYLRKLPPSVVDSFQERIVNIHPALLPRFGGKGMFGSHVHNAVIESGVPESGVTVHYVNNEYDEGEVIAQRRIKLFPEDTAISIQKRILQQEHILYSEVIERINRNLINNRNQ